MKEIKGLLEKQRAFFKWGKTRNIPFRIRKLKKLYRCIEENEAAIEAALKKDLNKAAFESYETEIGIVLDEIRYVIRHLPQWAAKKWVPTPMMHFLSYSAVYEEPLGVVLILAPWNYPFQLNMMPLIGAIAAGNCAVLKPSEYAVHTAKVVEKIVKEVFSECYVSVISGGQEVSQELLSERFDHIFFTGSPAVGKVVMEAASKYLTPVTLELGGKSPCIVDETADLRLAAKRIIWGKLLNAGQTCIAPDYLLVQQTVKEPLIREMEKYIRKFYGECPEMHSEYPKIINEKHFRRLMHLIEDGRILSGGWVNMKTRQIAPTLIDDVDWNSPVMQEEIFGPILPILTFEDPMEVIPMIDRHPKPLALYLFTKEKAYADSIIGLVSFGGGCINDTMIHIASNRLMFGGTGTSGMGQYHGKYSFETFSHKKSIVRKSNLLDIDLRYPPYRNHLWMLKTILK